MRSKYFPLFVDLTEKQVLVVGAGNIAARRIRTLLPFTEHLRVVSPEASSEIRELAKEGKIQWTAEKYSREDLQGADLVLACTDDPAVNDDIHAACRCLGIPVNLCNDRTKCDFYFPAIVEKEDVVVGITANGRNHHLAKEVRENVQELLEKM